MNAMSVSPVKPTINPGNHAVPATATNLTKSPLPSSNFAPINLIPDTKPIPTVNAVPANTENSVDLCSKPPTSNGIVSPIPETNSKENSADIPQNHNEKNKAAENLTIDAPPKPLEVISETKNAEKPKPEEPKNTAASKENSEFVKGKPSTISGESAKELAKDVKPITEDKKTEPAVNDVKEIESPKTEAKTAEANSEPVPEPKTETSPEVKSTTDKAKEQKEQESEANNEKDVKTEENKTEPSSETPPAPKPTKRKAKQPVEPVKDDGKEDRKSKRTRLPTQPYQSPIPELQFIAKLQTPAKPAPKPTTEKIIAFFKNEFLAVRNPEGSFYICQTFQNIHKSSSRIRIRWFTNLPNDVFTPDFCDVTEFDCILTNVQMTRVEKDRWKLPEIERTRIENILKRALDVEKGVADTPSITEEHPDGLDLSLFKDEAQLKKKKKKKSASPKAKKEKVAASGKTKKSKLTKSAKPIAATPTTSSTKKSARLSNLSQTAAKETATEKSKLVENKTKKDKKKKGKQGTGTKASPSTKQNDKTKVWEPSVKSSNSSKVILSLKKETPPAASKTPAAGSTTTKTTTKRTSSVSSRASATSTSPAPAVPQKRRKDEPKSAAANQPVTNERTGKVRNAGSAVAAKINSAAMRTTKEKERKVSNTSSQRKK